MTKPVTIPNTFATATTAIPLSQLDSDFSTVATALNDANTYSNYAADTGVANAYVVTLTGVSTTYSAGLRIQFKAGNANTGASTLNVNGGGTKNITFQDASALSSGTIAANAIVDVMYDGTQFLLMNDPAGTVGTGDVVGPASATDNAIVRFDGTTGKLVQNSVVTIADSTGDMSGVGALTATGNVSFDGGSFVFNESGADKDFRIEGDTDANLFFTDASTDRVGIGTSSPGKKLDVILSGSNNTLSLKRDGTGSTGGLWFSAYNASSSYVDYALLLGEPVTTTAGSESGNLIFYTRSAGSLANRMTLDSSGNLGLGVTPSAWGAGSNGIEISGYNGQIVATTPYLTLGSNTYYNGSNYIYKTSGTAAYYQQNAGTHLWFTAPSGFGYGTAATSLTSTQNGNSYTIVSAGTTNFTLIGAANNNVGTTFTKSGGTGTGTGTVSQNITFTQAMTLDASGRLGIGETSPSQKLTVGATADASNFVRVQSSTVIGIFGGDANGGYVGTDNAYALRLFTNNTERARIDSSGYFLRSASGAFTSGQNCWQLRADEGAIQLSSATSTGTPALFYTSTGTAGTITTSGTSTAYNTSSDYRLKDNPQPLTGSGAFIDALKPKTWNWKADGSRGVGFIAHEVQEVSPGSVVGEKDGEQMQAMEYGSAEFIANIIAELQSLRQRVALLEGTQP